MALTISYRTLRCIIAAENKICQKSVYKKNINNGDKRKAADNNKNKGADYVGYLGLSFLANRLFRNNYMLVIACSCIALIFAWE